MDGTDGASLRPALMLIGLVLLVRLVYTVWLCPYNLVEDEAHYWLWSRHLDWSYYSKGPGIAWAIALSTRFFGDAEWAVRLPTVLAHALGALACAGLARDLARRAFVPSGAVATPANAAVFAAGAFLLAPAFQATGLLVTIDGCYLACWAAACWAGWRALCGRSHGTWFALGAALGLGFLFKYTILLLIPGLAIFALLTRATDCGSAQSVPGSGPSTDRSKQRSVARGTKNLALATAPLLLGIAPVLAWNAREGWPTLRHLMGHLGMRGGDMPIAPLTAGGHAYSPLWTLDYLAAPFAMIGPLLVIATIAVWRMLRRRPREEVLSFSSRHRRLGTIFLVCTAAPILLFYLAVSFVAEPEQNWALAGFVTIAVLAGWYAADELARRRAGANDPTLTAPGTFRTRPIQVLWRLAILYGLCAALVLHRGDLVALALNRIGSVPIVANVFERLASRPGRPIITGRLIGSERMAAHAARILDGLRAEHPGSAPFIMAEHYGRASQLAYYLSRAGRPETVLSPQSVMGGRRSQFDFWADTALDGPQLLDQPALLLSNDKPVTLERWRGMFERVEPLGPPWSAGPKLDGEHKKDRVAYLGYGYRGPPDGHAQRSSRLRKARPSPQQ